ncbi:uncharacterized protein LOC123697224 isoform X2 [Colias croceus]|uniref:uncharacterized protein LOC123697224 isoform X2 n=1 Tax=Colias crocea TaxID=72248 RepID=UPI001E28085F|nr:uncharacterized protein LOC123697224 isoform X2 [Colias croceus]
MQTKNINLTQEQRNQDICDLDKMCRQDISPIEAPGSHCFQNQVTGATVGSTYYGTIESVPPYRMPPAPEAALPGAPAPSLPAIHTHSAKFPIEREVILSSGDKNSKVPILQEARKRGRLGAVAPDTPPKALSAWTHAENQQAGTSGDFRQYHEQYGYAIHQAQNLPRNQNYDSPKPPIPAKNAYKTDTPNNSHMVTVVETGKDSTRDAPKSAKSVSKTYHTLKDMISSRFKGKESNEGEKEEASLNNIEERKREPEQTPPKEVRKEGIYGRPMQRPEMQYNHGMTNNMAYPSPSPHRQLMQQQMVQHQMMNQARSQEMLAHRPQALGADALYQQYGPPGRRSAMYQRDLDVRSMANFTSLKTGPQAQFDNSHSRPDLRSPQQLEREIIQQRRFIEGRRASSHPHLLDEPQRPEVKPQVYDRSRRNSHGNLLDGMPNENGPPRSNDERESDDGGFRMRLAAQGRSSFERIRTSGRSVESRTPEEYRRTPDSHRERRTPDSHRERRTPDSVNQRQIEETPNENEAERNDENISQKSADSVYNSSKTEAYNPQPSSSRQTPNRIEDLKASGKKGAGGSAASSDYDKNGGQSSNVDSGRGSVAYSSGRRADASLHDTSADSDGATRERAQPQPGTSQQNPQPSGENEWADRVECELRQILEPKLSNMRLDSSDSSDSSITPPLPPLSPSSDLPKRNSLPGRSSEYPEERRRGRESPRWHTHTHSHTHSHKKHSTKRDQHYKKHLFGLDTTDMTSTTTRSLDLSSLLDARTDSDASSGDARAIRRQLRGLETMYAEVLQLLGVRKPGLKQPAWEPRCVHPPAAARPRDHVRRGAAAARRAQARPQAARVGAQVCTSAGSCAASRPCTPRCCSCSACASPASSSPRGSPGVYIRRQLRGLETMYAEVLQLLGVRKPGLKQPAWEPRCVHPPAAARPRDHVRRGAAAARRAQARPQAARVGAQVCTSAGSCAASRPCTPRCCSCSACASPASSSPRGSPGVYIRRQLRGLETMYAEVLQLLGVRKPGLKQPAWEPRCVHPPAAARPRDHVRRGAAAARRAQARPQAARVGAQVCTSAGSCAASRPCTPRCCSCSACASPASSSPRGSPGVYIRRQLRGLETMYAEVLQLLGVRKPGLKQPAWEPRCVHPPAAARPRDHVRRGAAAARRAQARPQAARVGAQVIIKASLRQHVVPPVQLCEQPPAAGQTTLV